MVTACVCQSWFGGFSFENCKSLISSHLISNHFRSKESRHTDMNLLTSVVVLGLCCTLSSLTVSGSEECSLCRPFILDAIKEAKQIVDDSYLYSRQKSLERVRRNDSINPADILRLMKQPKRKARQAVRAADYLEQTLRIISEKTHHTHKRSINATALLTHEELETIERLTGCAAQTLPPMCRMMPDLNRYRTATSICNNRINPLRGASNVAFTRWLPPVYEDAISQPQGWNPGRLYNGVVLPLVRLVSNRIFSTQDQNVQGDNEYTLLITFFGQWNDHDLSFTPMSPSIRSFSNGINCDESCERSEPCFPIQIPRDDPRLPSGPNSCLPVFRSAPACGSGYGAYMFGGVPRVREQINTLTSFLDAGQLYGSEEGLAQELRDLSNDGGLMRVNNRFRDNGRELLPFTNVVSNMCTTRNRIRNTTGLQEVPCFIAGDERVDENIALTSLHTLFLREHNRIARALRRLNPQWGNEQLYQETRKIVGAYHQIIVFRDYLPHIVGTDAMRKQLGKYPGYNPNVDPTISNVFATAAYRFAHATIQPLIFRLNQNFQENQQFPSVPLHQAFFTPWRIVFEGGIDPQIRGLISRPAKLNRQDSVLVDAVRERLFAFTSKLAQDLGSLNLQRSRDHGLPGYNAWRRFCGLSTPRNAIELGRVLNNTNLARRLIELYGSPNNIDLWAGGIAEPFVSGGRVGAVFSCIIATQFQKIRQGDRLWWENMGVFTPAQRNALSRVSLSRIICDNTAISRVPRNPFILSRNQANFVNCRSIPGINLNAWRESDSQGRSEELDSQGHSEELGENAPDENEILRENQFNDIQDLEDTLDNQVSQE
ncbi:eosinophil peroxidase isoform X2 [Neoarius graeffei]|uniref:eosinophil peroxidase isoform X2 n=1 Tax=Neoarius graeffei TaxID=443677 RepID=UPI00298CB150|nr:eosinophil peroxidase isoform X2 [Neoarius graeffei]